jgi:hypothetical protein
MPVNYIRTPRGVREKGDPITARSKPSGATA